MLKRKVTDNETRQKLRKPMQGGRRRSKRQIADVSHKLMVNTGNISEAQKKLEILTTRDFRPIKLIAHEGSIVGWEPSQFTSHQEAIWWKLVAKDIPGLFEVFESDSKSAGYLRRGFDLRYKMKWGMGDEVTRAKEVYSGEFGDLIRNLPEQQGMVVWPLLGKINEAMP
jgi:hypothetical protein